jgi:hypothetical protein
VRCPLDVLRPDFPHHQITVQDVRDKLFYMAEAADRHVQPRFAQAETADREQAQKLLQIFPRAAELARESREFQRRAVDHDEQVLSHAQSILAKAESVVAVLERAAGEQFTREYRAGRLYHHTRQDVASFLDGLELIDPGITEAREWRAPACAVHDFRGGHIWAAVARKAGKMP